MTSLAKLLGDGSSSFSYHHYNMPAVCSTQSLPSMRDQPSIFDKDVSSRPFLSSDITNSLNLLNASHPSGPLPSVADLLRNKTGWFSSELSSSSMRSTSSEHKPAIQPSRPPHFRSVSDYRYSPAPRYQVSTQPKMDASGHGMALLAQVALDERQPTLSAPRHSATWPVAQIQQLKPAQTYTGPIRSSRPAHRSEYYSRPTAPRLGSEPLPARHVSRMSPADSDSLSTEKGVLAFLTKFDDEENTGFLRYLAAKFDKICQRPRGASLEAADMSSIERSLASRNLDMLVVKKVMGHMKSLLERYTADGGSPWAEFPEADQPDLDLLTDLHGRTDFVYVRDYICQNFPHVAWKLASKLQAIASRGRQKTRIIREQDMQSFTNTVEPVDEGVRSHLQNLHSIRALYDVYRQNPSAWP